MRLPIVFSYANTKQKICLRPPLAPSSHSSFPLLRVSLLIAIFASLFFTNASSCICGKNLQNHATCRYTHIRTNIDTHDAMVNSVWVHFCTRKKNRMQLYLRFTPFYGQSEEMWGRKEGREFTMITKTEEIRRHTYNWIREALCFALSREFK